MVRRSVARTRSYRHRQRCLSSRNSAEMRKPELSPSTVSMPHSEHDADEAGRPESIRHCRTTQGFHQGPVGLPRRATRSPAIVPTVSCRTGRGSCELRTSRCRGSAAPPNEGPQASSRTRAAQRTYRRLHQRHSWAWGSRPAPIACRREPGEDTRRHLLPTCGRQHAVPPLQHKPPRSFPQCGRRAAPRRPASHLPRSTREERPMHERPLAPGRTRPGPDLESPSLPARRTRRLAGRSMPDFQGALKTRREVPDP